MKKIILGLLLVIFTLLNSLQAQADDRKKTINQVQNTFLTAKLEAADARKYCKQIHGAIANINTTSNIENCAAEEKFRIYKKHAISYPAVLNILTQEFTELVKLGEEFTREAIFGRGSIDEVQKNYDRSVRLIINRTDKLLMEEAQNFGEKIAAMEKKEKTNDPYAIRSGSAFFVNNKGNILTNNHVIEKCRGHINVIYGPKEYTAKVVAKDGKLDLAVLSSDIKPNQYLKLSKKSGDKLDRVVAAGYPLGYKISDELKLTAGIVSATKGWKDNINEFQIDAALNPGNSGGPVVNDAGNLFGVAVAGLADRQNLNFAIKSKAVKDFLDVNKVSYSTATIEFDMDNKKRLKLLEDSTVFIYCN